MIHFFNTIGKEDIALVGGKASNLGELYKKFNIPNGFVVTTKAYRTFIEMKGLQSKIMDQLSKLDIGNHNILEKISKEMKRLILDEEMLEEIGLEIKEGLKKLKGGKFAVRSSATAEDLLTASFAGAHDSFLNVKRRDVAMAVKKCWASLFNPRAIYYRHDKKIPHDVAMAVVVQEMIDAEIAGVMFTLDPIKKKYILVEAAHGLGEQVVSGSVTPSSFLIDRNTFNIVERNINYEIDEEIVKEIAQLGLKIEKHYQKPQDIEFAVRDKVVYILQSRAITTI